MIVLIVRNVRPGVRGRLTRWLVQPQSGIYVGHPSARLRDRVWELVCTEVDERGGAATMIVTDSSEQGFSVRTRGRTDKVFVDFDGVLLPKTRLVDE